jgi:hypothetical protein
LRLVWKLVAQLLNEPAAVVWRDDVGRVVLAKLLPHPARLNAGDRWSEAAGLLVQRVVLVLTRARDVPVAPFFE